MQLIKIAKGRHLVGNLVLLLSDSHYVATPIINVTATV